MAFSYGRKFRRIAAEALSADPSEMRERMARILPPRGENAAPVLRVATEADDRAAPAVIVAAFFADQLTADEVVALLGQVGTKESLDRVEEARRAAVMRQMNIDFSRALIEGPRMWGIEPKPELLRSVNRKLIAWGEEPYPEPCGDAASEGNELVNISENTSAAADGDAPC
jgi:hypothetical protein